MRTIIAGSRGVTDPTHLADALRACGWTPTVVLSGTARGADQLGELYCRIKSVPLEKYPAKWGVHGKRAGMVRNWDMATKAEALIALWDGKSPGTKNMIARLSGAGTASA